jgi:antibiotic biosynthesis monooxygenase (ABM) superfamily enzyme
MEFIEGFFGAILGLLGFILGLFGRCLGLILAIPLLVIGGLLALPLLFLFCVPFALAVLLFWLLLRRRHD